MLNGAPSLAGSLKGWRGEILHRKLARLGVDEAVDDVVAALGSVVAFEFDDGGAVAPGPMLPKPRLWKSSLSIKLLTRPRRGVSDE